MHNRQGPQLPVTRHLHAAPASASASGDDSLLPRRADDDGDKKRGRPRALAASKMPALPYRLAELLVILGLAALVIEAALLPYTYLFPADSAFGYDSLLGTSTQADVDGSAPDWMVRYDRGVPTEEREHLSVLRSACTTHNEAIIPSRVGRPFDPRMDPADAEEDDLETLDAKRVLNRGDERVVDELRRCPDVDIYLDGGIRGLGYCEDASAYTKFLESRMLPLWVLTDKFEDPDANRTVAYHELCPDTPLLFFNHYWDGIPEDPSWPKNKPIYLMPNIEMRELTAQHYWRADVVLCKTLGCRDRVSRWYDQEGNPRGSKVFFTKHTSSDVAHFARKALAFEAADSTSDVLRGTVVAPKDFGENIRFTHTAGSSVHKGTPQVLQCWLARPDFPPLDIYMHEGLYEAFYRDAFGDRIARARNIELHHGQLDDVTFGRIVAESAFFLCPSTSEGYGHYINQARASGGLVVTTNAHPMNELISSRGMGVLLNTKHHVDPNALLGGAYIGEHGLMPGSGGLGANFLPEDLCDAVDFLLHNTTVHEREQMGAKAQRAFHEDTKFFARRMLELRAFAREQLPNGGDVFEPTEPSYQLRGNRED